MLHITKRLTSGRPTKTLTLPFDQRLRSRLRVVFDDGAEGGLFLDRGKILRGGDLLGGDHDIVVEVQAAPEPLSRVPCDDPLLMARVCYHLGNRHVALQIDRDCVTYQHDHVLDDMVRGFGLEPETCTSPFEPEAGAYDAHTHQHSHSTTSATHHDD